MGLFISGLNESHERGLILNAHIISITAYRIYYLLICQKNLFWRMNLEVLCWLQILHNKS